MIRDAETLNALLDAVKRFVRGMKARGLFGLTVPGECGSLGVTMQEEMMVMLAMGQASPAFRSLFGTTAGIG